MRPSGRNAMRHGSVNVATVVMLNGTVASGFWSPPLTWAEAADGTRDSSNAVVTNFIVVSPSIRLREPGMHSGRFAAPDAHLSRGGRGDKRNIPDGRLRLVLDLRLA